MTALYSIKGQLVKAFFLKIKIILENL